MTQSPSTTTEKGSEYRDAGVDYRKMINAKHAMVALHERTRHFPEKHGVFVQKLFNGHAGAYKYIGRHGADFIIGQTMEDLGNKNWIAEWMYANSGILDEDQKPRTFYDLVAICAERMATNDNGAHGFQPIAYTDQIEVGNDGWYSDMRRMGDLAHGFFTACQADGVALVQGESAALKFIMPNSAPPIPNAPTLSGCAVGIAAPSLRLVTGELLRPGDVIIGFTSSGLHANGISLIIKTAMGLREKFMTKLSDGKTFGEHALIPTRSYVPLTQALPNAGVNVHAWMPGTGDGIGKLASDSRQYHYNVKTWLANDRIPDIFRFMLEQGISKEGMATTFNMGIGYYAFVSPADVAKAIEAATKADYEAMELGVVEEGKRGTYFAPWGITLPPPGE